MSQAILGEKINVSQGQISDWENGRFVPGVDVVLRIIEATNCDFDLFFTGEKRERVSILDADRALLDAYHRADEKHKRLVKEALDLEQVKGDKDDPTVPLLGKKKPKDHKK